MYNALNLKDKWFGIILVVNLNLCICNRPAKKKKEKKQSKQDWTQTNTSVAKSAVFLRNWATLTLFKGHSTFFFGNRLILQLYNRVKQLSFTVFESIQPISGSGGSTFSLA